MTECPAVWVLLLSVFILIIVMVGAFVFVPVLEVVSRRVERKAQVFFGERPE